MGKRGEVLVVQKGEEVLGEARLGEVSRVVLMGNVGLTAQALHLLCAEEVPIVHTSAGGWLYGMTLGVSALGVERRVRQFEVARDEERSLALARVLVGSKLHNARVLLRRNGGEEEGETLGLLKDLERKAKRAVSAEALLGIEGSGARAWFGAFGRLVKEPGFAWLERSRRPPKDRVNALLSYGYGLLVKEFVVACVGVGFDPYVGVYHRVGRGKPALALDLMEPMRPLVVDALVYGVLNKRELRVEHFLERGGAVSMSGEGKKRFLEAYERRMGQEVTHPEFGYAISYRRLIELQVRLLDRHWSGELEAYPSFEIR